MGKIEKIYMRTTMDEFELPIAVAGSAAELARLCGTTKNCVASCISKHYKGWYLIEVEEEDLCKLR